MRRLLLLPALALVAPLLVASPASAATVDTFTIAGSADDAEATAGATLSVAWDVTPVDPAATLVLAPAGSAVDVVDGWNAAAVSAAVGSTVDVTIPADAEAGDDYTFQIVASENNVPTASDTITVSVVDAVTVVTPAPVVVDGCEFVVPEVAGVEYEAIISYEDEDGVSTFGEPVDAGRYPVRLFSIGEDLLIAAYPTDGFEFPAGAVSEFSFPVSEDCFPTYVETESICQGVTITNITDVIVNVYYGDSEGEDAEGEFALAPGDARTVSTTGELVVVVAGVELDLDEAAEWQFIDVQTDLVEVDQDCTPAGVSPISQPSQPSHPTVAPAAGR